MNNKLSAFINPHAKPSTSLWLLISTAYVNRQLIIQMIKREILGRYRGSIFGLFWSLLNPIVMLIIYTFVFAVIFKAKWGEVSGESKADFALILFAGMNIFAIFSESITKAPSLIINNSNYVKKVVFPLEVLSIISVGSSLFHGLVGFIVLTFGLLLINGFISWTIIFLPLIFVPLVLFSLGLSWFLASLGVFLPDLRQAIGIFATVLLFLSPVFYPVSALPEAFQKLIFLNPLTFIIEQTRAVLIFGSQPDWYGLVIYSFIACGIAWLGFVWFQKTRKGFADVL